LNAFIASPLGQGFSQYGTNYLVLQGQQTLSTAATSVGNAVPSVIAQPASAIVNSTGFAYVTGVSTAGTLAYVSSQTGIPIVDLYSGAMAAEALLAPAFASSAAPAGAATFTGGAPTYASVPGGAANVANLLQLTSTAVGVNDTLDIYLNQGEGSGIAVNPYEAYLNFIIGATSSP
jgi:hypothetical protein